MREICPANKVSPSLSFRLYFFLGPKGPLEPKGNDMSTDTLVPVYSCCNPDCSAPTTLNPSSLFAATPRCWVCGWSVIQTRSTPFLDASVAVYVILRPTEEPLAGDFFDDRMLLSPSHRFLTRTFTELSAAEDYQNFLLAMLDNPQGSPSYPWNSDERSPAIFYPFLWVNGGVPISWPPLRRG